MYPHWLFLTIPAPYADAKPKSLPFHYHFAAGAIAGVSEILVMYPLDGE
jgi:solute carrier family 25 2-oxodicarboxylate transporter 21